MPALVLLLDVLRHFSDATDAVNFIKAADIPLKEVPDWAGQPALKIQVGESSHTAAALEQKNYYKFRDVDPMDAELKYYGDYYSRPVKVWARAAMSHGINNYWKDPDLNFQVGRYLELRASLTDPMTVVIAQFYFNWNVPESLSCYMTDGGECFVRGWGGWEHTTLKELLTKMMRHVSAEFSYTLPKMDTTDEQNTDLLRQFTKICELWPKCVVSDKYHSPHLKAVTRMLRINKEILGKHGAFD